MIPRVVASWVTIVLAVLSAHAAGELSTERQREVLRDALNVFDQAVGAARDNPAEAEALYGRAAAGFESLRDAGVDNAALEYNLGNTYFRLGRLGRAVAHYRRAARRAPSDRQISANLEYARDRVEPRITPTGEQALVERLLFWHNTVSIGRRFWIGALASIAGWLGLIVWRRARARPLLVLSLAAIVLGAANAGSVAWQLRSEMQQPHAVVVGGEHVLRLGRGAGYDPAIDQPLGPGVELRILEKRGGWVEVRLRNDQIGWLPEAAIERL